MLARAVFTFVAAWSLSWATARAAPVVRRIDAGPVIAPGAVWAVARGDDGTLWVGANGLAFREAGRWGTVEVPGAYAFRALATGADHRVWFGAIGAVGWVERDGTGQWVPHSLVPELQRAGLPVPGDIWQVWPWEGGALFVATDHILAWDGESIRRWSLPGPSRPLVFGRSDGPAVYQPGVGVKRIRAARDPELLFPDQALPAAPLTWQVVLPDGAVFAGFGDGAYRQVRTDAVAAHWERLPALSAALGGALPTAAIVTGDGVLAVATLQRGVVFADRAGNPLGAVDEAHGLDDNVYALTADRDGAVLAGGAGGPAMIESPVRVESLDLAAAGVQGVPRKIFASGGGVELLTARALYSVGGDRAERLMPLQATLWDAGLVEGRLWVGGFGGLWSIQGGATSHEHHVSADVPQLTEAAGFPGAIVFLENYALRALEHGRYGWVPRDLGPNVGDTPLSLVEGPDRDLWVSTAAQGIQRFRWVTREDAHPQLQTVGRFRPGAGLPVNASRLRLARVGGRLVAFGAGNVLALNGAGTAFAPADEVGDFVVTGAADGRGDDAFWLVRARRLGANAPPAVIRVTARASDALIRWEPVAVPGLDTLPAPLLIGHTGPPNADALWLADRTRLLELRLSSAGMAEAVPAVTLRRFEVDGRAAPVRWSGKTLAAGTRRVGFAVAPVVAVREGELWYESRLDAESDWSPATRTGERELAGLGAGKHRLIIRGVDRFGRTGPEFEREFVLAAPWYLHPAALAGFVVAAGGLAFGFVRWRLRRLERQNARLEQLVADRTRELKLANTAKSEFLENISHELRNPLNGLNGLLALLREDQLGERERGTARSLRACAEHLTRVFEEVLGYARLEYGAATLHPVAFSVRTLLQGVADLWSVHATANGGSVRVILPDALTDGFEADADKIKTIVGNFVSNAVKYAPGSAVILSVEVIAGLGDRVDLHFEVSDHGPGIAAEEQELVFRKFVRGRQARATAVAGTGLGLATCRVLAKALNGDIGVESEPGHGATFYLRVPVRRRPVPPAMSPESPPATDVVAPGADDSTADAGWALVVDDEEYNRTVMMGIALSLGYRADAAASGAETLQRLAARAYRVVFLDWELPDASGGQVAARIRAGAGAGPRPWIVAITAHDSDEMPERCRNAGMDGFLLKPCRREQVAQLLERLAGLGPRSSSSGETVSGVGETLSLQAFEFYARAAPARAGEAVTLYLAAVERELADIDATARSGNLAGVAAAAHRLRALGGIVGATEFTRAAARLENSARARSVAGVSADRQELAAAWQGLRERIRQLPPLTSARG